MLWILEIWAEFPWLFAKPAITASKSGRKLPKIDLGQPTKDVRLYANNTEKKA